jgi:excisionase family DNA binding protein
MLNYLKDNDKSFPPRLLNVNEVAHLLHVHPNTVRLWSKIGVLKAYRVGRRREYRFNIADVETFLHRDGSPP